VRIGIFRDSVFTFYYPENTEALEAQGAELVPISSLDDSSLPADIDALYIGGGFPETQVTRLTANEALMRSVRESATAGLPIYAECGGLIYLSRSLQCGEHVHGMAGVLPVDLIMNVKPVGHGYSEIEVSGENPFLPVGTVIRGHEFHYSGPVGGTGVTGCMTVRTGVGLGSGQDGLLNGNALGLYTHVHADGVSCWAEGLVKAAARYRAERKDGTEESDITEDDADQARSVMKLEVV
jgi:cobyrinic acid a,c-diamide synthase